MKKFILSIFLALTLFITPASAEFFPDIIVTSPNGIWTDSRAYETLNDAISAVGANERTIKIVSPQTVTALTIPSNVTLEFERDGAIVNSGQLTINTRNIRAPDRQIFTGAGDVDFADGSVVRSAWFPSLYKAINLTNDDSVTLLVTSQAHVTTTCALGNDVILKWISPNNIIQVDSGVVFSNIKNIEAGNYQIFAGLGDYDFLDGTELKLNWFHSLQSVLAQVEDEEVTIIINEDSVIQADVTAAANEGIKVVKGGRLNIDAGVTLTINGSFSTGLYQVFSGAGSTLFGQLTPALYPEWWGIDGTNDEVQINLAITASNAGTGRIPVVLSGGPYSAADTIYMRHGVRLIGWGGMATSKIPTSANYEHQARINVSGSSVALDSLPADGTYITYSVENVSFVGDGHTGTESAVKLRQITRSYPLLKNVEISTFGGHGIEFIGDGCHSVGFENLQIQYCGYSGVYADVTYLNNITFSGGLVEGCGWDLGADNTGGAMHFITSTSFLINVENMTIESVGANNDLALTRTLLFTSGSTEPTVGQIIEGATSGHQATIVSATVESGAWGSGDAAGYLTVNLLDFTEKFYSRSEDINNITTAANNVLTSQAEAYNHNAAIWAEADVIGYLNITNCWFEQVSYASFSVLGASGTTRLNIAGSTLAGVCIQDGVLNIESSEIGSSWGIKSESGTVYRFGNRNTATGGTWFGEHGSTFYGLDRNDQLQADSLLLRDNSGSWTPAGKLAVVGTSSNANQLGAYRVYGDLVYFRGSTEFTKGTGTGNFTITGLPFTSDDTALSHTPITITIYQAGSANETIIADIDPDSNVVSVYMQPESTAVYIAADDTDLDAVATARVSGWYIKK